MSASTWKTHQAYAKSLNYLRAWSTAVLPLAKDGKTWREIEAHCRVLVNNGQLYKPTASYETEIAATIKRLRDRGRLPPHRS